MTNDIVEKLRRFLAQPVDSECKVVYLLAEIRKLLDFYDSARSDKTIDPLWMHCHWALHVDLAKKGTTISFLDKVDRWVTNTVAYLTPRAPGPPGEVDLLFQEFLYLESFRKHLRNFLDSCDLPTSLCDDAESWSRFVQEYSGVIEDGTLSVRGGDATLAAVEKLVFKKGAEIKGSPHLPFVIEWTIWLKDGRSLTNSLQELPVEFGKLCSHNLRLHFNDFVPPEDEQHKVDDRLGGKDSAR